MEKKRLKLPIGLPTLATAEWAIDEMGIWSDECPQIYGLLNEWTQIPEALNSTKAGSDQKNKWFCRYDKILALFN